MEVMVLRTDYVQWVSMVQVQDYKRHTSDCCVELCVSWRNSNVLGHGTGRVQGKEGSEMNRRFRSKLGTF